jgi:hypothetical protein
MFFQRRNDQPIPSEEAMAGISRLDRFVDALPSAQTAVDAIPGWNSAFPASVEVVAGDVPLYEDPRLTWAMAHYGPLMGCRVLELGPLEGGHTYMLARAGASIDAVEMNKLAYLRCLIAKEILEIPNARYHLGNFLKWLDERPSSYDLIVASGVLYHQAAPLFLLELIARRTTAFYLWTHFFDEKSMPAQDQRREPFIGEPEVVSFYGRTIRQYRRTYVGGKNSSFCGGMYDEHRWLHRDDLLEAIRVLGFGTVAVAHEDPHHPNGPAFSVFARR